MDELVDLAMRKMSGDVQKLRNEELTRKGGGRGAGVVGKWPEIGILPAASCGRLELLRGSLAARI